MRLAGIVKGGYYPCPPEAVRGVGRLLSFSEGALLDPCAGEGEALAVLAGTIGCPWNRTFGIELERERSQRAQQRLPESPLVGPASFFDMRITRQAFSLLWLNPPFDTNVQGTRVEYDFLAHASDLLVPGGVLALIVPETVVERWYLPIPRYLVEHFEHLAWLTFPAEQRKFREVAVLGTKRRRSVPFDAAVWPKVHTGPLLDCPLRWVCPVAPGPKLFEKGGYTDDELREVLADSPLWRLTQPPPVRPPASPPLPLSKGHIALLLASGQLDGVVSPPGEAPHVVRGTAIKVAAVPEVVEETLPDGAVKTTTTIRERIQLVVRAVESDGVIHTFQ